MADKTDGEIAQAAAKSRFERHADPLRVVVSVSPRSVRRPPEKKAPPEDGAPARPGPAPNLPAGGGAANQLVTE